MHTAYCIYHPFLHVSLLHVSLPDLFPGDHDQLGLDALVFLVPRSGLLEASRGGILPGFHQGGTVMMKLGSFGSRIPQEGSQEGDAD